MDFKSYIVQDIYVIEESSKDFEFYQKKFKGLHIYSRESIKTDLGVKNYSSIGDDKKVVFWVGNNGWKIDENSKTSYNDKLYKYEVDNSDYRFSMIKKDADKLGIKFYFISDKKTSSEYGLYVAFKKGSDSKYVRQLNFESFINEAEKFINIIPRKGHDINDVLLNVGDSVKISNIFIDWLKEEADSRGPEEGKNYYNQYIRLSKIKGKVGKVIKIVEEGQFNTTVTRFSDLNEDIELASRCYEKVKTNSKYVRQLQFESVNTIFKVGDKVEGIGTYMGRDIDKKKGKVVNIRDGYNSCCVYWDEYINGHTCGGLAKDGHGWAVPNNKLKKIQLSKHLRQLKFD